MNIKIEVKKVVIIEIDADDALDLEQEIRELPISGPALPLLTELLHLLDTKT